jgi:hypothetical protein
MTPVAFMELFGEFRAPSWDARRGCAGSTNPSPVANPLQIKRPQSARLLATPRQSRPGIIR